MKYRIEYQWSDGTVEKPTQTHEKIIAEFKARDYQTWSSLAAGAMYDIDDNPPRVVSWELIPEV